MKRIELIRSDKNSGSFSLPQVNIQQVLVSLLKSITKVDCFIDSDSNIKLIQNQIEGFSYRHYFHFGNNVVHLLFYT